MKHLSIATLAGACLFASNAVISAELPVPYNHVEYKQSGNTYTWTPLNGQTPRSGGVSFPGRTTISTVEPKISTLEKLPYDNRASVPDSEKLKVTSPFTKANFGKAIVGAAKVGAYAAGGVIPGMIISYLIDLGVSQLEVKNGQLVGMEKVEETAWLWTSAGGPYTSAQQACGSTNGYGDFTRVADSGGGIFHCYAKFSGNEYVYKTIGRVANPAASYEPINEQRISDRIGAQSGWSPKAAEALKEAISLPGVWIDTETPTVTGPSSIPGAKSVTKDSVSLNPGTTTPSAPGASNTDPGTKTTTKTETKNNQYSGNSVTTNTTTNTTTTITNNVTNQTTNIENKTEVKEDDKEEQTPSDTPLGDIPELYKQKYPDGIGGVLNQKIDEIKATPLFNLPSLLAPSLPSSGSCPSWQLDLSLASWAGYGVQTIQAPCWVWGFGKVVIIISALLLARRLIFGG